mmetsp:Transcript_32735/g.74634  ORF Transcript_32735/g.74634 Transcript_32735/m.74634 type:complete len:220 (+) Transcript_32735:242-901(+)
MSNAPRLPDRHEREEQRHEDGGHEELVGRDALSHDLPPALQVFFALHREHSVEHGEPLVRDRRGDSCAEDGERGRAGGVVHREAASRLDPLLDHVRYNSGQKVGEHLGLQRPCNKLRRVPRGKLLPDVPLALLLRARRHGHRQAPARLCPNKGKPTLLRAVIPHQQASGVERHRTCELCYPETFLARRKVYLRVRRRRNGDQHRPSQHRAPGDECGGPH